MDTSERSIGLLIDREGRILMATSSAADLLGGGRGGAPLEGRSFPSMIESPSRGVLDALLASLGEGAVGGEARLTARVRIAGERFVHADLSLARAPDAGPASGRLLIGIEPKGKPELLAAGEPAGSGSGLSALLASHEAAFLCQGGVIEEIGEGLAGWVGLTPGSLSGWRVQSFVAAEDLLPVMETLRALESGERQQAEFAFALLRAKEAGPMEVSARARRILHGGQPAVMIGLSDIGDSLRAARLAADRIEDLDSALAATSEAVVVVGEARVAWPVIILSRTFERMFGLAAADWLGRPFDELGRALTSRGALPETERLALAGFLHDPAAVRVDTVGEAGAGRRVLERRFGPVRDRSGRAIGSILTFRDVTARIEAEEALKRTAEESSRAREELQGLHEELRLANEGLERRMTELNRLNRDLRILDEMKSNLLANVSHELQTPLVSVKGFTEMILKRRLGEITAEQERGLSVALRNVNRLIGLIEDLLAFARGEEGAEALRLEVFPLGPLAAEAIEVVRERARGRGISITLSVPQGDLLIRADRNKVYQVFLNLLTNAVKYNKDQGEVAVEATRGRKGTARIDVKDSGIGIPREDLDRIFDRGFQAGNAGKGGEGAGLGLSITKNLLRQHGCMIRVDSEEGRGSLFSFTLPLDRKSRTERSGARPSAGAGGEAIAEPSHSES